MCTGMQCTERVVRFGSNEASYLLGYISKQVGLWTLRQTHHSAYMANKGNGGQILDESSVLGASER